MSEVEWKGKLTGDAAGHRMAWRGMFRLGGIAALTAVLVMTAEIIITLLPGGGRVAPEDVTVVDWFKLFQDSWFLGLRNLGLINMIATTLLLAMSLALFGVFRRDHEPWAGLALILSIVGASVYLAGNTGFAMLRLSEEYAAATNEAQRGAIEAAGRAMLAMGESHTPGTFVAFLFLEVGGILMSILMLDHESFGRGVGITGIVGNGLLLSFEAVSDFIPALFDASLAIAGVGGLLSMAWYVLTARGLFRQARAGANGGLGVADAGASGP
jgi:hypothetical protein